MNVAIVFWAICAVLLRACTQPVQVEHFNQSQNLGNQLEQAVHTAGIKKTMVLLARVMEQDPEVTAVCHGLAHKIGHAAYDEVGLQALQDANDLCGSGYFHGVIERHFANSADVLTTFKDICSPQDGRCFHGLGHGLMFANKNDLPESIALCDQLQTRAQKVQCSEGVFMENFNSNDTVHPTEYKTASNPFYPCNLQKTPYKAPCTFYAVRYFVTLHPKDTIGVIDWCNIVDIDAVSACIKGIGSALAKYHMHELDVPKAACDLLTGNNKALCYDGIVSYIIVHNASTSSGQQWCNTLTDTVLKNSCEQIVQESKDFYGE